MDYKEWRRSMGIHDADDMAKTQRERQIEAAEAAAAKVKKIHRSAMTGTMPTPQENRPVSEETLVGPDDVTEHNRISQRRASDPVNHPSHYTEVVPGIECIEVTEHFSFLRGNAIKYLWRAGAKGNTIQDLEKARWYVDREIKHLKDLEGLDRG